MDFQRLEFAYRRAPEQGAAEPALHPVVVVGAGPVGLALAIDLAQRGQRVLLLDNDHKLSTGSRAICFAKRTLEIFDRLGVGQRVVDKGVSWRRGRVFFGAQPIYGFDLLPEPGHERPAFVNLQQFYVEGFLAERAAELANLEIRWLNKVSGIARHDDFAALSVDTPDGPYTLHASWVAACDGSRSTLRALLGLESQGRVFQDRFLIADVKIESELFAEGRAERWFWFDPPFHRGQSVLLHRQPDAIWRIDFQLGWSADPEAEKQPERIVPRVQALLRQGLARDVPFTLEWASVYTFACQRMARFRHGRVLFAGDAAHGVSPFGARGANSGVQDAENLAWKLAAVLQGRAPDSLLDSYAAEREFAADENILHSTRATDFITPKSQASRVLRDAVLALAREHAFARRLVNSGRLSVPATLDGSPLSTPDGDGFDATLRPGAPAADAPLRKGGRPTWLLRELGPGFTLLVFGAAPSWPVDAQLLAIDGDHLADADGLAAQRYDARPGTAYLLRPDGHVAARWRRPTEAGVQAALARCLGHAERNRSRGPTMNQHPLTGFGNQFESEAVAGALPIGRNSPQQAPLGLYAELLSGSAFTAPRADNRRTWMYRRQPSVLTGAYEALPHAWWKTGAAEGEAAPPDPLRWHPTPVPDEPLDFIAGLRTVVVNGDADAQAGIAAHLVLANRSMTRAFVNADGEMLLVPQQGALHVTTELGVLDVAPGEIALLPRGLAFKVAVDGPSRAYVCENYGAPFRLPELGPIGSNGLANARDFIAPSAAFEADAKPCEIVRKSGGRLWRATAKASPFNVVAWHGNLVPFKYDTARFMTMGSISYDHPDPSIFTVLTSPSDTPGTANCDFVIFPPRWLVAEDTFRPPWYHRNVMSEFMGLVLGQYDAKPEGFRPGGMSLHNSMVPHGPDAEAFDKASRAALAPHKLDDTLAFMFESRWRFKPTAWALNAGELDRGYADCWAGLADRFEA